MSEIIFCKVAYLEPCSERRNFDGGHLEVVARGTLGVHHSLVGKNFKLVFPTLISRVGDYIVVPVELVVTKPDDGDVRRKVVFAKAKIAQSTSYKEIAHPTTAQMRELVTNTLFTQLGLVLKRQAEEIAASDVAAEETAAA